MTALGLSQQLERKTSSRYFSYEMKLLLIGSAVVFEVGQLMVKAICTLMVKEREPIERWFGGSLVKSRGPREQSRSREVIQV